MKALKFTGIDASTLKYSEVRIELIDSWRLGVNQQQSQTSDRVGNPDWNNLEEGWSPVPVRRDYSGSQSCVQASSSWATSFRLFSFSSTERKFSSQTLRSGAVVWENETMGPSKAGQQSTNIHSPLTASL